jgi:diguanylate cyclase (GGDEF)-like protein
MFSLNKILLRQALDLSPIATVIVDMNHPVGSVVYANQAFEAMSGFDASELVGRRWAELLSSDADANDSDRVAKLLCHPRLGVSESLALDMVPLYERPGTPRYWMGTEQQATDSAGGIQDSERDALLSVLRDARMHLRRLDGRDSTTGILSRRAFDDMLQRDWVLARRDQRSLSLMLFQIDAFQEYSEVFGRHAADSCLRKVAHSITGSLKRAGDLTARFEDDQFVVLVAQGDENKVADFATSIGAKVRGLAIHHPRSPVDRFVTVSIGVASMLPGAGNGPENLIEKSIKKLKEQTTTDKSFNVI